MDFWNYIKIIRLAHQSYFFIRQVEDFKQTFRSVHHSLIIINKLGHQHGV